MADEVTAPMDDCPRDYSFAAVNEFVHRQDTHYEALQWLCLGLAGELEKSQSQWHDKPPVPGRYVRVWATDPNFAELVIEEPMTKERASYTAKARYFGPIPPDPQKETGK